MTFGELELIEMIIETCFEVDFSILLNFEKNVEYKNIFCVFQFFNHTFLFRLNHFDVMSEEARRSLVAAVSWEKGCMIHHVAGTSKLPLQTWIATRFVFPCFIFGASLVVGTVFVWFALPWDASLSFSFELAYVSIVALQRTFWLLWLGSAWVLHVFNGHALCRNVIGKFALGRRFTAHNRSNHRWTVYSFTRW